LPNEVRTTTIAAAPAAVSKLAGAAAAAVMALATGYAPSVGLTTHLRTLVRGMNLFLL